jgi:molybdopterin biosynthesis enzyme MoaB
MRLIKTEEALGQILCHDMTRIVPGECKETRFRKGQLIRAEDIPVLLDMGKEYLYVWEKSEGMLHEEEGAGRLRDLCTGENLRASPVREGKIELFAECRGLFKINPQKLTALNEIDGIAAITVRGNRNIAAGEKAAVLKIIPLLIEKAKLEGAAEACGGEKILRVIPYVRKRAGLIITGNEVYHGRIPESGSALIRQKLAAFPAECAETLILPDVHEEITAAILGMIGRGLDLIICTGGMSVDPDDRTPLAIRNSGARVVSYGVPVNPGTMLMLAYYEKEAGAGEGALSRQSVPVLGLPACVFHDPFTAFDLLLPRIMAGDTITREELALLGDGGLQSLHER